LRVGVEGAVRYNGAEWARAVGRAASAPAMDGVGMARAGSRGQAGRGDAQKAARDHAQDMARPHDGEHEHEHAHEHQQGASGDSHFSELELRVKALESLLVDKGLVDPAALDTLIDTYETQVGPRNGARVVARAWVDPQYRRWLLDDATAAIASLGYSGRQGEHMVVVENTDRVHNLVVCTLCSCYPWPVLGLPPVWYKSSPYRARAVIDPRGVIAEFGEALPADVEVRVWDSTAEIRYLVLPQRPAGTAGWSEEQLAAIVSRDAMIGVVRTLGTAPAPAGPDVRTGGATQ
jgi:nitrile hydratase